MARNAGGTEGVGNEEEQVGNREKWMAQRGLVYLSGLYIPDQLAARQRRGSSSAGSGWDLLE